MGEIQAGFNAINKEDLSKKIITISNLLYNSSDNTNEINRLLENLSNSITINNKKNNNRNLEVSSNIKMLIQNIETTTRIFDILLKKYTFAEKHSAYNIEQERKNI